MDNITKSYVFVDADSILYSSCYGDDVSNSTIYKRYMDRLNYIKVQCFSTDMLVTVKGHNNFRDKLDPEYKANRKPLEPIMKERLKAAHAYALELGAVQADGWEADDQVVSWAYEATQEGMPWVIAAIDKDLLQVPGTHFNYGGTEKKPLAEDKKWNFIDQKEGDFRFARQLLTGDTVDNIKGIHRVGPVKAGKALEGKDRKGMMNTIVDMYKEEYKTDWERKLIMNCNLVYMRRWLDDEFDYKVWLNE